MNYKSLVLGLGLILMALFGVLINIMSLKIVAIIALVVVAAVLLLIPIKWSLFLLFFYLGFEGIFKVISNYNVLIHIGSDILVILLCVKALVLLLKENAGIPSNKPPFWGLLVLHFIWVFIMLANPYSLSLYSSIAGSKIYLSMVTLYLFGYYVPQNKKDIHILMIPWVVVALVHTGFGLYQGFMGPSTVLSIHPRYAVQLAKYEGLAFRPFGLTNLPGGPAIFLYLAASFILYFIYNFRSFLLKALLSLYVPLMGLLFLLCQIRSALMKGIVAAVMFLAGSFVSIKAMTAKQKLASVGGVFAIIIVLFFVLPNLQDYAIQSYEENLQGIERTMTLFEYDKVSRSRRGAWERFWKYAGEIPFGAGFARVGASAGKFKHLHMSDPHFSYGYFFADNFWLAALIEVGIPGMLIMTTLIFLILGRGIIAQFQPFPSGTKKLQLAILCSLIAITIGLYGAEGILYNPESAFFWFFAGVLMRLTRSSNGETEKVAE